MARSRRLATVFREPIDALPAGVIFAVGIVQLAIFAAVHRPLAVLASVVVLFPFQLNFAGMCHNHHHRPTFRRPLLNRVFEVVMFLQLGMLPYGYTLQHNIGHHRHYLDQSRDSNRWRRADGGVMGPWAFAWTLCVAMYPTVWRIGRRHPVVFRKFRRMAWICAAVLAALFALDPVNAVLVYVLPLPFALLLQAQATYYQHAGLDTDDPLRASRSAVDPLYNLRTLNLGYHAAHHFRPSVHWSKLPALHAAIAADLPPDLVV
ncbi:MAG TPA: fatty acid desaturase [Dongiaceae bacterium]|nr:fatty acid desaturase [Dongiaceae bacterium]